MASVCVIIELSHLPVSAFIKSIFSLSVDFNSVFMVGSVLLLIGLHCGRVLSPLCLYTHRSDVVYALIQQTGGGFPYNQLNQTSHKNLFMGHKFC